jgi:hypothetical protein
MYIARKTVNRKIHYVLRESCAADNTLSFRNLFELGTDPSQFIVYPGGNAYYISDRIQEKLHILGVHPQIDELEDLFWPFLRPDIKRAVEHFMHRSTSRKSQPKLSAEEAETIKRSVHPFDKRRAHYLRFGDMDQGSLSRMPPVLVKNLYGKSRDEIEQHFIEEEQRLKITELKSYVYTAFDLQRFFAPMMAKKMPQAMDQDRVDHHFLEELCHLNQALFHDDGFKPAQRLHDYLVRYLIMFFDHDYENTTLLDDFVNDFIYRHHFYKIPVFPKPVSMDKACEVFGVRKEALKTMTKTHLTRLYRRLAQKYHPDKGGSNEKFIELNETYEELLQKWFKN